MRKAGPSVARAIAATCLGALVLAAVAPPQLAQTTRQPAAQSTPAHEEETPWPYEIVKGATHITIYPPQLDEWDGIKVTARAAVAVRDSADEASSFGTIVLTARTLVDKQRGLVTLDRYEVTKADFPGAADKAAVWTQILRDDARTHTRTIALARLEASKAILAAESATPLALKNDPPAIILSTVPAMLVYVDGTPRFSAVPGSTWQRLVNTRVLILQAPGGGALFLHVFDGWMTAKAVGGPWSVAAAPPAELASLQQQAVASQQVDLLSGQSAEGQPAPSLKDKPVPVVHVALKPTELVVSDGALEWTPIPGTQLQFAENTTGNLFRLQSDQRLYLLISGRWFRAAQAAGPWQFVPANQLAQDFAKIPDDSPKENVKASVAGTPQAREAAIAATIPSTAAVKRSEAKLAKPVIDGDPVLAEITGTPLLYVRNTATPLIKVDDESWFAVENGVWFSATSLDGPWTVATYVPAVIYTIPASSPLHYVTYVKTYGAEQGTDVVYVGYTPGYQGQCVDPVTQVVVYGTGYYYDPWIGAVWYGPPVTYGYGVATTYTPWGGWGLAFGIGWYWGMATVYSGWGWGPYPYWGPYYYGGVAYGPRGGAAVWGPGGWAASTGAVYNRWGDRATVSRASTGVNYWTGNAWAGHAGVSYNSRTGNLAAGQRGAVQNIYTGNYASSGRGIARNTESGMVAAGRAGTIGNAYTGREISGGSGVVYNPNTGNATTIRGISGDQGRVVDVNGDIYAGHDGNVYRKTDDGWQQHADGGWQPIDRATSERAANRSTDSVSDRSRYETRDTQRELSRDLDRQRNARDTGSYRYQGRQRAMGSMRGMGGGGRRR